MAHFPTINVASDGHHYNRVTNIGYTWQGKVNIDSGAFSQIKSWTLSPSVRVEGLAKDLSIVPVYHKVYPWGTLRPQKVSKTVGLIYVADDEFFAAACNLHLEQLMNQGFPRATVLAENRRVAAVVTGLLDMDFTLGNDAFGTNIDVISKDIGIVCDKSPIQPPKPAPKFTGEFGEFGEFELDSASLVIFPGSYSGECRKDLTLFMKVRANHPGAYEARIESTAGWKPTKFSGQTNESDDNSGLWTREFSEPFTVPVKDPAPGGGGTGGIPPGPGNFQPRKKPEDTINPGSTGPKGPGDLTAKDPGSNVHKQSLRLVAQANGKTVYSDWKQYHVVCDPKLAITPATTAFLPGGTGGPKPPKPSDSDPKSPTKTRAAQSSAQLQPARGAQPDLKVVRARRPARSPNTVEFLVENEGAGARSSAQLTCQRSEGGFETWTAPVPAIPAGGQQWVKTSPKKAKAVRTPVRGCHIRVDQGNAVPETDEKNNDFSCGDCADGPA